MPRKKDCPKTHAIRILQQHGIEFEIFAYAYEERGGTRTSARELGVDEHAVIKTLIMETNDKKPFVVLMHGDREVSTKQLARFLEVKSVGPCEPKVADRYSGYTVGGTSPFGTRRAMDVYAERSLFDLDHIYINAGRRGFLIRIDPKDMRSVLKITEIEAAI